MAAASIIVVLAAGPALAALTRPVAAAPGTAAVDLGTLPGGTGSGALGVNPTGQIVGYSSVSGAVGVKGVLWDRSGPASFRITDLGTLPGGEGSFASGINAAGLVVGSSGVTGASHAAVWTPTGSGSIRVTDLGTLPGGLLSSASHVNDAGVIAGYSDTAQAVTHAAVWTSTGSGSYRITDLGTLPGDDAIADNATHATGRLAV